MRILLAAVVSAFVISGCQTTAAQSPPVEQASCPQHSFTVARLNAFLSQYGFAEQSTVDPDLARVVARNFNAIPPATNWDPEKIVIYANGTHALLVFYVDGCVTGPQPLPFREFERFMRKMVGQGV